jgi:hypothetical protein
MATVYPKFHFCEVLEDQSVNNLVEAILGFAEARGVWANVERDLFFTVVTVEVESPETAGMFDLLFGSCDKY